MQEVGFALLLAERMKPVKVGDVKEVEIEKLTRKGDGFARIQGFVIFVKGAKEGERCKIRIVKVFRRFAIARKL